MGGTHIPSSERNRGPLTHVHAGVAPIQADATLPTSRSFLVADIRGYTRFSEDHGDVAAAHLATRFVRLAREVFEACEGTLLEVRGDEVTASFKAPDVAVGCAVDLQRRYAAELSSGMPAPVKVGMGLDVGELEPGQHHHDVIARAVASRLCQLARGGEILASEAVVQNSLHGPRFRHARTVQVAGLPDPIAASSLRIEAGGEQLGAAPALVRVRIHMLGGFRVVIDDASIDESDWRLKKASALVKLVALTSGHRLHRDEAVEYLWPELDPLAANNNLHHALHVARRVLNAEETRAGVGIKLHQDLIVFDVDGEIATDVEEFEVAAHAAETSEDPQLYDHAISLYGGDLLPTDVYEDWAAERREVLRGTYHGLLLALADLREARGEIVPAIAAAQRAAASDPTLERAHATLIRLYAATNQRHQAIRQYELLRRILREELDAEPQSDTTLLYRGVLQSGPDTQIEIDLGAAAGPEDPSPHPDPIPARSHNLPLSLTSFIGRRDALDETGRLVRSGHRLITLTGPGGGGKTRLAIELTGRLVDGFRHGVWLVGFGALTDPQLLMQEVADALSIAEIRGRPIEQTVTEFLRDRQLLLLLDACEHMLEGCRELAETVLHSCPGVQLVTTSREPLGLPGELIWPVPPLSVPQGDAAGSSESVQLFVERARQRQPAFELNGANARWISDICMRLDGIPLAIELAAARVGMLSLEQLAERLHDALGLLTGGRRTSLPHQQTMRSTIDWSYELLEQEERLLFARLSVFAGGWTLEAAEVVGASGEVSDGDVLDLLSRLVDKSLILSEISPQTPVRYRMLEPVLQYAREHVHDCSEVSERHAAFFVGFAERAQRELLGPAQNQWLELVDAELENIRAALGWAIDASEAEIEGRIALGLRLATALWRFWHTRGHIGEGRRWLQRGLVRAGRVSPLVRAEAMSRAAWHAQIEGDLDLAAELLRESLDLLENEDAKGATAFALETLGDVRLLQGDVIQAREVHERSLELRRVMNDSWGVAMSLNSLALVAHHQDEAERTESLLRESLIRVRQLSDLRGIAIATHNLGRVALDADRLDDAFAFLAESLSLLHAQGNTLDSSYCLDALGRVAGARGDSERAACLFGAAEALRDAVGARLDDRRQQWVEQVIARSRADVPDNEWRAAWEKGIALSPDAAVDFALSLESATGDAPPTTSGNHSDGGVILSGREREVAALVARGLTNRQIAGRLIIAERTVDTHVSKILSKLGLVSRAQVAAWAIKHDLVESERA